MSGSPGETPRSPRLQGEAAWAYRKVGALYSELGRDQEADAAYERAISRFEELLVQFPEVPEYRARLVETSIMADPGGHLPNPLERLEQRLRRAKVLIDALGQEVPDHPGYLQDAVHCLCQAGGPCSNAASNCVLPPNGYEHAIELQRVLVTMHIGNPAGLGWIGRSARKRWRLLQSQRGQNEEARRLLNAAVADLQSLSGEVSVFSPPRVLRVLGRGIYHVGRHRSGRRTSTLGDRRSGSTPGISSTTQPKISVERSEDGPDFIFGWVELSLIPDTNRRRDLAPLSLRGDIRSYQRRLFLFFPIDEGDRHDAFLLPVHSPGVGRLPDDGLCDQPRESSRAGWPGGARWPGWSREDLVDHRSSCRRRFRRSWDSRTSKRRQIKRLLTNLDRSAVSCSRKGEEKGGDPRARMSAVMGMQRDVESAITKSLNKRQKDRLSQLELQREGRWRRPARRSRPR